MKRKGNFTQLVCTVLLLGFVSASYGQTRVYVKPVATGTGDGSSWANAREGLAYAMENATENSEIWVAGGTYLPDQPPNPSWGDRYMSFLPKTNVKIYGSFAGTETSLSERTAAVMTAHPSILSGDIGQPGVQNDNTYHVVLCIPTEDTNDGVLDGFTITGGNANEENGTPIDGHNVSFAFGGGINFAGLNNEAGPRLANLTIKDNYAIQGGGMFLTLCKPTMMRNCKIINNVAGKLGGGLYCLNSALIAENIDIQSNTANDGAGLMTYANSGTPSTIITRSRISGNNAFYDAGGIHTVGVSLVLNNVLISGNHAAYYAGGLYVEGPAPYPDLTNVTIADNNRQGLYIYTAGRIGDDFLNLRNSIIYGNELGIVYDPFTDSINIAYSLVQGRAADPSRHLIDGTKPNPKLFVNAPGYGTTASIDGDYRLKVGAIAVNKGSNAFYAAPLPSPIPGVLPEINLTGVTKDLDSLDRIADLVVDLGAYEGINVANLMPVLSLSPSIVNGETEVSLIGEISEFNSGRTSGLITVYVLKDLLYKLAFNPAATSIGGQSVDNSIWSFDSTSNSNYYILTTSEVLQAMSVHRFGLTTNVAPGGLNGKSASGIMILPGSGGDINNNDNGDDDILVYQPE